MHDQLIADLVRADVSDLAAAPPQAAGIVDAWNATVERTLTLVRTGEDITAAIHLAAVDAYFDAHPDPAPPTITTSRGITYRRPLPA